MCVGSIYIYVRKSQNFDNEDKNSSFRISSDYVSGGSCSYIHENSFAYCGESNLEDCRTCKRPGCTIIQCGAEVNEGSDKNPLIKFVNINKLICRKKCMSCVYLILYQVMINITNV